jgi:hypothetical protein
MSSPFLVLISVLPEVIKKNMICVARNSRNRFLGLDSWAPEKFKNTVSSLSSSVHCTVTGHDRQKKIAWKYSCLLRPPVTKKLEKHITANFFNYSAHYRDCKVRKEEDREWLPMEPSGGVELQRLHREGPLVLTFG